MATRSNYIVACPDDMYTHVLMDEREVDYDELLAA